MHRLTSCTTAADCSYNGDCVSHRCECDAAWRGPRCAQLALLAANLSLGYHGSTAATSTWGASVQYDHGMYHAWASEMAGHCGINAWTTNSFIMHAISSRPLSEPFVNASAVLDDPAFGIFSHEPIVVAAPGGLVAAFYTHSVGATGAPCRDCTDGSTAGSCDTSYPTSGASAFPTLLRWANRPSAAGAPWGSWSAPVTVFNGTAGRPRPPNATYCDTNLAPTILTNGSLVGLWRECSVETPEGTYRTVHPVTAADWREPSTYAWHADVALFEGVGQQGGAQEDPFVWRDAARGVFHALFHHRGCASHECGGHAYSEDGVHWRYTNPEGDAFGPTVELAGGGTITLARRERPQLLFQGDDDGAAPIALLTGVQPSAESDATFTLLQPLRQAR